MGSIVWLDSAAPASPAEAIGMLQNHLSAAGTHRMYSASYAKVANLSIRTGLTVWCFGGQFRWRDDLGETLVHPAADPEGAARLLTGLAQPLSAAA